MEFQTLRTNLTNPSWLAIPQELIIHRGEVVLTKTESRSLLKEASNSIANGMLLEATNALFAGLLLDEQRFLQELQKLGLLRISRHCYSSELLTSLVSSLCLPELGLSPVVLAYLTSVKNLYRIAASVRLEYERLLEWLTQVRERGIRGLFGTLDFLFLKRTVEPCPSDPSRSSRDPLFHSAEDFADGLSAILALYFKEFGQLRGNVPIDTSAAVAGEYVDVLVTAAHLVEFREWELLVDRFSYHLDESSSSDEFRLRPVSDEFLRALEYGYIQDFMQRCAKSHLWHDPAVPSYVDIGRSIADKFMSFVEEPLPRYRCEFPDILFSLIASVQQFTQEEQKTVTWACREMSISLEELFAFDFGNGVTIHDLFRLSRVVSLMHGVAASKLLVEPEDRLHVVFNSLVPALPIGTLETLVAKAIGHEKVQNVIELLTLKSEGHVDVLYAPLIPAGPVFLLPVNLFVHSNIFRNPLMATQKRLFPDGRCDPLSKQVADCFRKVGASVLMTHSYSWGSDSGECDVMALWEGHLFVCECKNSLLPTGMHELRTSLDHIEKAADQLSRFTRCFDDNGFRVRLSREFGQVIGSNTKLVTSIMVSNRMLLGLRVNGIPVRGNNEFDHFVDSGDFDFLGRKVRPARGDVLSVDDLRRFFDEDTTYVPQWAAMEGFISRFEFSDCAVSKPHLRLNFAVLAGEFGLDDLKKVLIEEANAAGVPTDAHGYRIADHIQLST